MRRDLRTYIGDILECIANINSFTKDLTLGQYEESRLVRSAVEREFTIIAEAMSRIRQMSPGLNARIEHVRKIADFRNFLVHQYEDVDDTYVWRVIHESVPTLKQQIELWAAEFDTAL